MLQEINQDNESLLFDYFTSLSKDIPYYFPVRFDSWHKSMFDDRDYDGTPLFSQLRTFILMNSGEVEGFIQFGLTSFVFGINGEKDYASKYGVIRNLHYRSEAKNVHLLMDKAAEYFALSECNKRYAFFHYFGMSCYARQGKLHTSGFYIEDLLHEYGYRKEHENVYYSRSLQQDDFCPSSEIVFSYTNGGQTIAFIRGNDEIGGCELYFVPQSDVCFLKWIFIDDRFGHQGFGTKCMYKLFYDLRQKGFMKLDTDTADDNINAQGYYVKTGFADSGRMRSYHTA